MLLTNRKIRLFLEFPLQKRLLEVLCSEEMTFTDVFRHLSLLPEWREEETFLKHPIILEEQGLMLNEETPLSQLGLSDAGKLKIYF